jgi:DNA-binding CsgD family transcriptional regulator/tetratricopeptide (TPR) repeat protein
MIGRSAEAGRLRGLLAEASTGSPRVAIIRGEAGIGKTRLIDEFEAENAGEVFLLAGQSVDLGAVPAPYAPIKGALRSFIRWVGAEEALQAAGAGRSALVALLPELASAADAGAMAPPETAITGAQLHEAIAVLLESFSRVKPVIVVIEDLHWIDSASLSLLRFLLRAVESGRILFVLSYRSEDVTRGHPLRGFLTELERAHIGETIEPRRLTRRQVAKQTRAILGDAPTEAQLDTVFGRSDGIPFFVEELLGIDGCSTDAELPDTLRDLLLARYERLDETTQAFLRNLAVGGVRVAHALFLEVCDDPPAVIEAAAREAVGAGVLVIDGDDYAFRHALVREAVLFDLLPGERTRFHSRYALAYEHEAEQASGRRHVAAEISFHWMGAHDEARAFPATLEAMRQARAAYAYSSAAQMGERALELWERVPDAEAIAGMSRRELLSRTASHLRNAGEDERCLAMVNLALRDCPRDDPQYTRLLRDKAIYLGNLGLDGSIPLLEEALGLLEPGHDDVFTATVLTALAGRLMVGGQLDRATELAEQALRIAQEIGAARYASVASNIMGVSRAPRDPERGAAEVARARELADGDASALLRYWVNASDLSFLLGRYDEAVVLAREGLERARARGVERSSGVILASNAVDPLFALGRWSEADELIERALALDPPRAFWVYLQRAKLWATLWRGDPAGAAAQWRTVHPAMAQMIHVEMQTRLSAARVAAEIALADGDIATAWTEASVVLREERAPLPGYALPLLWAAARVLRTAGADPGSSAARQIGDLDAAWSELRAVLDTLTAWPTWTLWAGLFSAEHSSATDRGTDQWEQLLLVSHEPDAPVIVEPYVLLQLARAHLADGDRAQARESLNAAIESALRSGVGLVETEARELAASAGLGQAGQASGPDAGGQSEPTDALTSRERQVLDLIEEGLSNRQIGERLFISGKTASVHVSAILRKLGASSRTEAVFRARG